MRCTVITLIAALLLAQSTSCAASPDAVRVAEEYLSRHREQHTRSLQDFLSIASISADPAHASSVQSAADWVHSALSVAGFEHVQYLRGGGHPSVYADWLHSPDPSAPTVLVYAHFDVQPADPLELWTTGPFNATIRDGRVYARGVSDDKGKLHSTIVAAKAYLETTGSIPVNLKFLFDGEEEVGSPSMAVILERNADLLKADYAFSADGGQISEKLPGICVALRGAVALQVQVKTADGDLHSGLYGGGVQNALHVLAELLARLHSPVNGSVLVNGFYDQVDDLSQNEKQQILDFPIDASEYLQRIGAKAEFGEVGYSFLERVWSRPSLEIVGMWGGFQGDGIKTVLPSKAYAKLSARLVKSQEPETVLEQVKTFIEDQAATLPGVDVKVDKLTFRSEPFTMSFDTVANNAAAAVLKDMYGRDPVPFRMGGSIPVMAYIQRILGIDVTTFAISPDDGNVHAPDEYLRLSCIEKNEVGYVRLLSEIAERHKESIQSDSVEKEDL